jgi:hypothetical protein
VTCDVRINYVATVVRQFSSKNSEIFLSTLDSILPSKSALRITVNTSNLFDAERRGGLSHIVTPRDV